ncbi:MAG TPA: CoA-binding protein [Candidatus Limnocylindrales bacterium]|jgi:hypothetical protein
MREDPTAAADGNHTAATGVPRLSAEERLARRLATRQRVIDYLDLQEGRGPVDLLPDEAIGDLLRSTRRIAVVGASANESRPSYGVFRYLLHQGYECVPINPGERDVLGVPAFRTLREAVDATGPFDLVDVFRRSELCPPHAREAVEIGARCLWLQLGVVSWEAARIAHDAGLSVVMDRCTAIEHRRIRGR